MPDRMTEYDLVKAEQDWNDYQEGACDALIAEIRALQQDVAREQHVRETAERESAQHAERTAQLYVEREKLERDKAALVDFVDAMTKDPPDAWRKKHARKVLEEVK